MDFKEFRERLEAAFQEPLPGQPAQYKMVPPGRPVTDLEAIDQEKVRQAAVAALFFNKGNRPHIILTLRLEYEGVHSGQISFPGGRREEEDRSFMHTALRETEEEIGVKDKEIELLGSLTSVYIPPSNFYVYPFVGILESSPMYKKQEEEVASILEIDFNDFINPKNITEQILKTRGLTMKVPAFHISGYTIWGATAMMISEIREMINH